MNQSKDIESEEDEVDLLEDEEEEEQDLNKTHENEEKEDDICDEVLDETESSKKYWAEQRQIDNFDFGFLEEDFYRCHGFRDNDPLYPSCLFMNSVLPTAQ